MRWRPSSAIAATPSVCLTAQCQYNIAGRTNTGHRRDRRRQIIQTSLGYQGWSRANLATGSRRPRPRPRRQHLPAAAGRAEMTPGRNVHRQHQRRRGCINAETPEQRPLQLVSCGAGRWPCRLRRPRARHRHPVSDGVTPAPAALDSALVNCR